MKFIKYSILLICCVLQQTVYGQSGRFLKYLFVDWPFVIIDSTGIIQPFKANYSHDYFKSGSVMTESNGSPLFVNDLNCFRSLTTGKIIKGSDSIVPIINNDFFIRSGDTTIEFIGLHDSAYIHYFSDHLLPLGIYQHTLVKRNYQWQLKRRNQFHDDLPYENYQNRTFESNPWFYSDKEITLTRRNNFNYRAVYPKNVYFNVPGLFNYQLAYSKISIFHLDDGVFSKTDECYFEDGSFIFDQNLLIPLKNKYITPIESKCAVSSLRSDKIFFTATSSLFYDTLGKRVKLYNASGVFMLNIDPKNGKFSKIQPMKIESLTSQNELSYQELIVSPNDSVLYFVEMSNDSSFPIYTVKYFRFRDLNAKIETIYNSRYQLGLVLGPYGQLLIAHTLNTQKSYNRIIAQANHPEELEIPLKTQYIDFNMSVPSNRFYTYDYIRIKKEIKYSCVAEIQFKNNSDLSEGLDSFVWFFSDVNGEYSDTVVGFEPIKKYSIDGVFPLKIHAYSAKSNYSEWYYDTVVVNIPKPLTYFTTSDTQVCAYTNVVFYSKSGTNYDKHDRVSSLTWYFGDGNSKSQITLNGNDSLNYFYQKPGKYSVSLKYNNGYCDSTFVRTFWMKVMESPKPGLEINDSVGCAPFDLFIKDTNEYFVKSKEYYFSDSQIWKPLNGANFFKTFMYPGSYYVVQRLQGYNGCVTQLDTVRIWIRPGLTQKDTSNVLYSTYLNDLNRFKEEPIVVWITWQAQKNAKGYSFFRDGEKLGNFKVTSFYDTLKFLSEYRYEVLAIDSCENESALGKMSKPILLKGEKANNDDYAILTFTDYVSASSEEMDYKLMRIETKVGQPKSVVINSSKKSSAFKDESFRKEGELEQCYRVEGRSSDGQITYSNIVCLPYSMVVYIPNIFTPNADGINDVFEPVIYGVKSYSMRIYSRWGEKIFEGNSSWNGTAVPSGNYIYEIELISNQNLKVLKKGVVILSK